MVLGNSYSFGYHYRQDPTVLVVGADRSCLDILSLAYHIQSTLVISKSKGLSKTARDIRTSTYQICSIEEKTI